MHYDFTLQQLSVSLSLCLSVSLSLWQTSITIEYANNTAAIPFV